MKKIMFNDRCGLTSAVLEGRKTMTRRAIKCTKSAYDFEVCKYASGECSISLCDAEGFPIGELRPMYQDGEVVAIAQNYKDAGWNADVLQEVYVKKPTLFPELDPIEKMSGWIDLPFKYHKGRNNKMFVSADLMPHHIKITDIKVERLQDISDEDCLREGVKHIERGYIYKGMPESIDDFPTAREAFASLIDKVSGKGTWQRNPWVFCYEFELID